MSIRTIDRYEVLRVLGKGAMGVVYLALDPRLDRRVAIKTVSADNLQPTAVRNYESRFLTEARAVARLKHPGIVQVFDSGQADGVTFLVMEYVNGPNLKQCLGNGVRFRPAGAIRMAIDVLDALAHAHGQKIIHRDIKPENILLDRDGSLKLTDFGIAKVLDSDLDNGTVVGGGTIGTPRYMSPEQVRGWQLDERSDMFSMGVTLYELLTGQVPFDGPNQMAIGSLILHETPPSPSTIVSSLPQALDAVLSKAMAKRPQDRFDTCEQFRQALLEVLVLVDDADGQAQAEGPLRYVTPDSASVLQTLLTGQMAPPAPLVPDGTIWVGEGRPVSPEPEPTIALSELPGALAGAGVSDEPQTMLLPTDKPMQAVDLGGANLPVQGVGTNPQRRVVLLLALALVFAGAGWWWLRPQPPVQPELVPAVIADPRQSLSSEESLVTTPATTAETNSDMPRVQPAGGQVAIPTGTTGRAEGGGKKASKTLESAVTPAPSDNAAQRMEMALPAPAAPEVVTKPAPPPVPAEPCTGLGFFERESCLWKQCKTEAYRQHPQCQRFHTKRGPASD